MARPHPHNRAARRAAFSILCVLAAVAAVWAAPRLSDAVAAWMNDPPVALRTAVLQDGLTVGPVAQPRPRGAVRVARADASATAPTAAAVTVDPGMTFTMVGVTCTPPARDGDVQVLLRTSQDGKTWSRWYSVALERVAEEGGPVKAFTEPIWTGSGRYVQVAAQRAGGTVPAPARLRDVHVVAINSSEDADTAATVLGVVRRTAATIAGLHFTQTAAAMTTKPHDRDARTVGRQRVVALRQPRLRARQDGVRPSHGQRQRLLGRRGARGRPRRLRTTTPSRCTGATSATTSSSTATASSTKDATGGSREGSSAPRCSASTPGAPASR